MNRMLLVTALLCGTLFSGKAQNNVSTMDNQRTKTIRLVYPQWQGGDIAHWITEVKDPEQASRGYYLGAQLLNFLAPDSGQETYTVPVATDKIERKVTDGVLDKEALIAQTRAALDILKITHPDKIVTLGGECSASVVPFTYLADKYKDDLAMVWIDAHPDITLPGDAYAGYHAMAVTACMGLGDKQLVSELPMKIAPSKILFVGLRDWERDEIKARQEQYSIQHLTPEDVRENSDAVSLTLPLRPEPYRSQFLFSVFANMLSEGENRQIQSQLLHIDPEDDFGILLATCQFDTIEAITIKPIES